MVVVLGEQAQCYRGNGVMAPAPVQSGKQAPAFLEGRGGGGGGGGRGGLTFIGHVHFGNIKRLVKTDIIHIPNGIF